MTARITVKKIAELCGISQPVVSAVLNRGKIKSNVRFSEETAIKVMTIADQYGYRPNRVAQNFQSQKHHIIGVLVHEAGNITPDAFRNLLSIADDHKQLISFESVKPTAVELPVFIRKDCVDGVLLFEQLDPKIHEAIARTKLPAISINAGHICQTHNVVFDEVDAIRQAVELFEKSGCERYVLTRTFANPNHYATHERVSTLHRLAYQNGLPEPQIIDMDHLLIGTTAQKHAVMKHLLDVFKQSGKIGLIDTGVMTTLPLHNALTQTRRQVPDNLEHIFIGNDPTNDYAWPPITRLTIDMRKLIEQNIEDLSRIIRGEKPQGPPVVTYKLIKRTEHDIGSAVEAIDGDE
ncbi:MAG TPA: hypothetical protein DCM28_11615 [Phycisphaerales bacterium]|nr:hypothetical protein [Phycisphaerales bacterium]HCD35375.1 hypothetical protein [Phycisphaerales bacterium]|tara:strand:- start:102 stop:1151 length:1050 start_codon:yes stop_codon:yes gene_type:complete